MKKLIVILLSLMAFSAFSTTCDTIQAESEIKEVTVFFSGAQVSRQVDLNVEKGEYMLMIDNLPFELNPQSIQLESMDLCKILSVQHQVKHKSTNVKTSEVIAVENKVEAQEYKIKELKGKLSVYELEESILLENSKLGNSREGSRIEEIKEAADFYRTRLGEIMQSKLQLLSEIDSAESELYLLYESLNELTIVDRSAISQILVKIDCEKAVDSSLRLRYYISSAGWDPSYDFRVEDISKPLTIVYNANVYQTSGEDWNDIKVVLSTNNPSLTGNKPELKTLYAGRTTQYKQYSPTRGSGTSGTLQGRVIDLYTRETLPFVNITLENQGRQVAGMSSDIDGKYIIKPIAPGKYDVRASFIGFREVLVRGIQINANQTRFYDIEMESSGVGLDEVVIIDYKVPLIDKDKTVSGGTVTQEQIQKMPMRSVGTNASQLGGVYEYESPVSYDYYDAGTSNTRSSREVVTRSNIEYTSARKVTNLEYTIEIPYTIPSNGEEYGIRIKEVDIPVEYVYYAVPKLDPDAFLTAEIIDWAELDLLDGESSIYYQGTFVGQSFINSQYSKDTLSVSLGRDNDIFVKREGNKEMNDRRVIGSNIKETLAWDISIRNNKADSVMLILEDQYPLSERKSIEVELLESSGAKVEEKKGKLTWELKLQANEKKLIHFKYSVKYPRQMRLNIE